MFVRRADQPLAGRADEFEPGDMPPECARRGGGSCRGCRWQSPRRRRRTSCRARRAGTSRAARTLSRMSASSTPASHWSRPVSASKAMKRSSPETSSSVPPVIQATIAVTATIGIGQHAADRGAEIGKHHPATSPARPRAARPSDTAPRIHTVSLMPCPLSTIPCCTSPPHHTAAPHYRGRLSRPSNRVNREPQRAQRTQRNTERMKGSHGQNALSLSVFSARSASLRFSPVFPGHSAMPHQRRMVRASTRIAWRISSSGTNSSV